MEEANENKNENGARPATKAQYALIAKLLEETQHTEIPPAYTNETMGLQEACKYIDLLKEVKSMEYQDRANHRKSRSVDRIVFGLCFKLVYNHYNDDKRSGWIADTEFIEKVWYTYELYTDALHYVNEKAARGGQQ